MKLAMIRGTEEPAVGVVLDDLVVDLTAAWPRIAGPDDGSPPRSVADLLARDGVLARIAPRVAGGGLDRFTLPLDAATLRAPLPDCGKLICAASNYAAHIAESGQAVHPDRHRFTPWLFLKPATTIIGPGERIPLPREGVAIDWEVELAVVIGRRARRVPADRALSVVAGYTIVNDVSERRFRVPAGRPEREFDKFFDWLHGKWFDGFAPMGPWVVTADEIPDPQDLVLSLKVNGRPRQQGRTSGMIYPVAELVAFASSIMTLLPADVIATGTPSGVGATTQEFLAAGDVVECEIERIGTLINPVGEDAP